MSEIVDRKNAGWSNRQGSLSNINIELRQPLEKGERI